MPNESEYNRRIIKDLLKNGVGCFKTSERFNSGIPDTYIQGGKWLELKVVNAKYKFSVRSLLRPEQILWLDKLYKWGDRTYVAVVINKESFIWANWHSHLDVLYVQDGRTYDKFIASLITEFRL